MSDAARLSLRPITRGWKPLRIALASALFAGSAAVGATSSVATAAVAPAAVAPAAAAVPVYAGSSKYVAVPQRRIVKNYGTDAFGYTDLDSRTIKVNVLDREGVPAGATAAVVNITIVYAGSPGFATAYPTGTTRPNAAHLAADSFGRTIGNLVHVKLGTGGAFNVYRSAKSNVLIDLIGVYVGVTDTQPDGRFVTLSGGSQRVMNTRDAAFNTPTPGADTTVSVNLSSYPIPTSASAAVVNLTAVRAPKGFWSTLQAGGTRSGISTLNLDANGQTRSAQTIVPIASGNLSIDVYTRFGGDFIVDLVGYYTGLSDARSQDGLFIPANPVRKLDTRTTRTLAPWAKSTYEFGVGTPSVCTNCVSAAVLNVTGTQPWYLGYLSAYPAGQPLPNTGTLSLTAWPQTISNHAIVGVSTRGVGIYTSAGAHMIVDVAGYFLGTPLSAPNPRPTNPSYSSNRAVWVSSTDAPVSVGIRTGSNLDYIADQGYAAGWTGLTNVATTGNVMLFAHRTKSGGPFRYLDYFVVGEKFTITGADGHKYVYLVVDRRVMKPDYTQVLSVAKPWGLATAQLVACSRADGTPTSLSYRIVITGRLVSVV